MHGTGAGATIHVLPPRYLAVDGDADIFSSPVVLLTVQLACFAHVLLEVAFKSFPKVGPGARRKDGWSMMSGGHRAGLAPEWPGRRSSKPGSWPTSSQPVRSRHRPHADAKERGERGGEGGPVRTPALTLWRLGGQSASSACWCAMDFRST